jgi:hypothetical protein
MANTVTIQTRRPGEPTVLARLQGLFPTSPTSMQQSVPAMPESPQVQSPRRSTPKSLKIRIHTWNMHDSVPKVRSILRHRYRNQLTSAIQGDLEELLGKVPFYTAPDTPPAGSFPQLSVDDCHPYHLVVM